MLQCTDLQISACWVTVNSKETLVSHRGGVFHKIPCAVQFKDFHCFPSKTSWTSLWGADALGKSEPTKVFLEHNSFFRISRRYADPNWTTGFLRSPLLEEVKEENSEPPTVTGAYLSNWYAGREQELSCALFSQGPSSIVTTERLWLFKGLINFAFQTHGLC